MVHEGRIAIATRSPDGRASVVAVLEAGGLFGELGLFDDVPRSADARALADSQVIVLEFTPVRAVLEANPELLWIIVRLLARRLRATDEALADAIFLDVPAASPSACSSSPATPGEFTLPVTQEELAAMVGASRERVNKALALFTRLGWIEVEGRNHYRFLDRQALDDRANL